jgi:hypothetical protein
MKIEELRIKAIEDLIQKTLIEETMMKVGIERKQMILLEVTDIEMIKDIEKRLNTERAMLAEQPKVLEILERLLDEAKTELEGLKIQHGRKAD